MLELKNICSGYGKKQVLNNLSVFFKKGTITSIIGPNGCGKSTLLKTAMNIINITDGEVYTDEKDIKTLSRTQVARKIAYLPQEKKIPDMTAGQTVLHGRFPHLNYPRRYSENDIKIAISAMEMLKIEELSQIPMASLSGGMRQNVYIAMALAQDTDYILLDEPTTYLDIANRLKLMDLLKVLANEGKGIVCVLHDLTLAMEYSDSVVVMDDGRIVAHKSPYEIYKDDVINSVFGIRLKRFEAENGFKYYCEKQVGIKMAKYFPLFYNIEDKKFIIIGENKKALEKAQRLKSFNIKPIFVKTKLKNEEAFLNEQRPDILIVADESLADVKKLFALCVERKIPINTVDNKKFCTFIFPAMVCTENLTVAISTNGKSPATAVKIKKEVEKIIPSSIDEISERLSELRTTVKNADTYKAIVDESFKKGRPLTRDEIEKFLHKENEI